MPHRSTGAPYLAPFPQPKLQLDRDPYGWGAQGHGQGHGHRGGQGEGEGKTSMHRQAEEHNDGKERSPVRHGQVHGRPHEDDVAELEAELGSLRLDADDMAAAAA